MSFAKHREFCEHIVSMSCPSPHRQTSLDAVAFAIDELKASVPIWKKEQYEDGSTWKENKECKWATANNQTQMDVEVDKPPEVDSSLVQVGQLISEQGKKVCKATAARCAYLFLSQRSDIAKRLPPDPQQATLVNC